MGYLGRRIGLSQSQGDSNPGGAGGSVGGGLLSLFENGYFEREGDIYNAPGANPSGLTATGGVISDYPDGGSNIYRAHIFTSSGFFNVTELGTFDNTVDYLVVAGGGAGAAQHGGGGGAGGYRTATGFSVSSSPGAYTVTIGAGGAGVASPGTQHVGNNGNPSVFGSITSVGGGGGGKYSGHPSPGGHPGGGAGVPGGSGGGGGNHENTTKAGGAGQDYPGPNQQGFPGGSGEGEFGNTYRGGGGGGAGGAGTNGTTSPIVAGAGGVGLRTTIAGPSYPIGTPGPGPTTGGWLAGGGGGGGYSPGTPQSAAGGAGGGGDGGWSPQGNSGILASDATQNTGGGGGGSGRSPDLGGSGGSGIVVVRYKIAEITAQAKASGGAISFYGGRTIHTFTNSGAFVAPGTFNETIRYVAVGGGGGGGVQHGGGGGAGGYTTADIPLNAGGSTVPVAIVIGAGGAGMSSKGSLSGTAGGPENNGNDTTIGFPSPVTAGYGGGGAQLGPPSGSPTGVGANAPLGSGGGGGMKQSGVTADNKGTGGPQGNNGGSAITYSGGGVGGGGGGAGAAGGDPSSPNPEKGAGGIGVQVHPYFRDPVAAPSATTPTEPRHAGERGGGLGTPGPAGQFYLAGGGGGGGHTDWPYSVGPNKWGADGGFGGGGKGGMNTPGSETQYWPGTNGVTNTGGGGGSSGPHTIPGGSGGSGIVLIAYPT